METIYEKVKRYIAKYQMISGGDTVAAGVSGGADSVCLLFLLHELSKEIDFRLLVVHVHHGMRMEADYDAEYVERLCQELQIPFFLRKVSMAEYAKENSLSPEEAGRELRYQAFTEVLEEYKKMTSEMEKDADVSEMNPKTAYKIAVAHNHNDRAETMLFHLFRGSGLKGLGSIRPVREQVIHPLLCLERTQIEAYLKEKNIAFCIDSTNEEDTYTRNKVRHHILAYVQEQICRNAAAHINAAADIFVETENYVAKQTACAYKRCSVEDRDSIAVDLEILEKEDIFLQKRILMKCIETMAHGRQDITSEHIQSIMEIIGKEGCKELSMPYHIKVYKEYNRLLFIRKECGKKEPAGNMTWQAADGELTVHPFAVPVPGEVNVPGLGVLTFNYMEKKDLFYKKGQIIPEKTYTKWFDYDKITTVLLLRTRRAGDYLTINEALQKKSVKEYMINEKIPKRQRERIYLLADGPHVIWIPGYRISQFYKVNENTEHILQVQLRERHGDQ